MKVSWQMPGYVHVPLRIQQHLALLVLALVLMAASAVTGAEELDWKPAGPAVGDTLPELPALPDQSGAPRQLRDLMGTRGLTLVFVRSADWCPYCMRQLVDLNARASAFAAAGYPLVSVSIDRVDLVAAFAAKQDVTIAMLADERSASVEVLGIRDWQYPLDQLPVGVPQPMIFIVSHEGRVLAKHAVQGFRQRPDPDAVLASAQRLAELDGQGTVSPAR